MYLDRKRGMRKKVFWVRWDPSWHDACALAGHHRPRISWYAFWILSLWRGWEFQSGWVVGWLDGWLVVVGGFKSGGGGGGGGGTGARVPGVPLCGWGVGGVLGVHGIGGEWGRSGACAGQSVAGGVGVGRGSDIGWVLGGGNSKLRSTYGYSVGPVPVVGSPVAVTVAVTGGRCHKWESRLLRASD